MTETHAGAHAKGHPYHMVDPSPWPAVGALAALGMAGGLILYVHTGAWWLLIIGTVLTLLTMILWWRDVVREATFQGHHTNPVQRGHRFGMVLFIASEVMFFAAFFWAFFNASIFPQEAIGGVWPPPGIETFDPWDIPLVNTIILLTSGATVTWAHHAIRENNYWGSVLGLAITVALGISFTSLQIYEYAHAPFSFRGGIYPSTFFMATGFHGFHVIIGTCFLSVCLYRAIKRHFKPDHHVGFEACAWYWHFVDVVWLFLFCWVYWWGGA
ncbi:MAG: cytochrome c oxidase subunit 3 [Alphaproteobacteria bacterium]